ncbi:hypothetical protein R3P38DRAFT_3169674 [Favolaschia claudopus]|uniref:Uncharacterized protein n=1 Tax=Favolaschia claudopus TaxID=2862362 RepID=A0AAW0E5L1_9AGAR
MTCSASSSGPGRRAGCTRGTGTASRAGGALSLHADDPSLFVSLIYGIPASSARVASNAWGHETASTQEGQGGADGEATSPPEPDVLSWGIFCAGCTSILFSSRYAERVERRMIRVRRPQPILLRSRRSVGVAGDLHFPWGRASMRMMMSAVPHDLMRAGGKRCARYLRLRLRYILLLLFEPFDAPFPSPGGRAQYRSFPSTSIVVEGDRMHADVVPASTVLREGEASRTSSHLISHLRLSRSHWSRCYVLCLLPHGPPIDVREMVDDAALRLRQAFSFASLDVDLARVTTSSPDPDVLSWVFLVDEACGCRTRRHFNAKAKALGPHVCIRRHRYRLQLPRLERWSEGALEVQRPCYSYKSQCTCVVRWRLSLHADVPSFSRLFRSPTVSRLVVEHPGIQDYIVPGRHRAERNADRLRICPSVRLLGCARCASDGFLSKLMS